ncbi:MAG: hypothetical protein Q8M73_08035 [Actinomycetota bacterium]|nr:hypothetical protein [Actinomycetota bacterium]
MYVALSAIFIAVGTFLAFAVQAAFAGIDTFVFGWLLIGIGVLGLILKMINLPHRGDYSLAESRKVLISAQHLASPAVISNVVIRQSTDSLG